MPDPRRRGTGWLRPKAASDVLYSILERAGKGGGVKHLPNTSSDGPSSGESIPARRSISMGKGGNAPREYRSGFGWHSLLLYVSLPLVLALALAPKELIEQIPGIPHSYASMGRGGLIAISARESHREAVFTTAQARGYSVVTAESVKAGLEAMTARSGDVQFVVIDRDSAGIAGLRAAVQKRAPAARVIVLPESATTAEIASQLIQAGLR